MPNIPKIVEFLHCSLCLAEHPSEISPRDWARTEFGKTEKGFQLWCTRHECNIIDIEINCDEWTFDDSISLGVKL